MFLSLLAVACSEAEAGRRHRVRNVAATAGGVNEFAARFSDWNFAVTGETFGDPWSNEGSDAEANLSEATGGATADQSTAGLTLSSALTNKGVLVDSTECHRDASPSEISAFGPDLHISLLFRYSGAANDMAFTYYVDTTNGFRVTTNSIQQLRVINSNDTTYNCDSVTFSAGEWYLIDYVYDADGGGAVGDAVTYVNGTAYACSSAAAAGSEYTGGGALTLFSDFDCSGAESLGGTYLAAGFRDNIADIDETEHDAFCASLGVCP